MARLRIVCVMPFYYPSKAAGGAGTQAFAIHQGLVERGHDVRVVTTDIGIDAATPRDSWQSIGNHHVWYAATRPSHRVAPYYTPSIREPLEQTLADADLLQMRVGLSLTLAMARKIATQHRVPYVYNSEGALGRYNLQSKAWAKRIFLRMFEHRILRDAAALQAFTENGRDDLIAQGAAPERIEVIPNGVEMGPRESWPTGEEFRSSLGLTDQPIVLFMGRIAALKGTELLLQAFAQVASTARAANLARRVVLCFAGPDQGMVEPLRRLAAELQIGDRVFFPGNLAGSLRLSAYSAAQMLVLPSFAEGLPVSVLEAAAIGIPVIVSDRCNLPEVAQFDAGRITALDSHSIAQAIHLLLVDEKAHERCAAGAARMVSERFALAHVIDQLESLYFRIANSRK